MASYYLTPEARHDLANILSYVALDNPPVAELLDSEFVRSCARLARMPEMGHRREDLTDRDIRFWPLRSYLIVYDPKPRPLPILRVLSGYQDVLRLMSDSTGVE